MRITARLSESVNALLTALDVDGEERRAARHLPAGQIILRMALVVRIDDPVDLGMVGQRRGHLFRAVGHALDPEGIGFEALEQDPGIEGAERGAGMAEEGVDVASISALDPRTMPPSTRPDRRCAWWPSR